MTDDWKKLLDDVGCAILRELQQNARISFAELGRRVGLSTPAALDRVRRLEEAGVILGYHAELDAAKVGMPIMAFIRISVTGEALRRVIGIAEKLDEVLECHRVTGTDSFVIKVGVSSVEHLQRLFDQFSPYTATTTSIILSSPVPGRSILNAPGRSNPVKRQKRGRSLATSSSG
ncbi:MAG TPA: Lrp/AsnC family transcriptional regulator [Bryobacteraceae bacterium]|nr:Lrp/AsnC family transcriptional regulator [Bryobacteraceae bacterium]